MIDIQLVPIIINLVIILAIIVWSLPDSRYNYVYGENRRFHKKTGVEEILCEFPYEGFMDRTITRWVKIEKDGKENG